MGSALGKCISKGGKLCPKRLKCCSRSSKHTVKLKLKPQNANARASKSNKARASQPDEADSEANQPSKAEVSNEGKDMFSIWWDSVFCKCCACFKRTLVADKLNLGSMEASALSPIPSLLPTLTFMDSVRIHPTDIARAVHDNKLPVQEPIQPVLKI